MPTIKVNDISMYYEIHGDGEPLVLITGLGNDISQYEGLIRILSQRNRVLAFDNRGAGRTDKPDMPYSIEMMADDTAGLMKALGIGNAHLLGISMGGRIAADIALRYPEQVKSLVLVSTFVKGTGMTLPLRLLSLLFRLPVIKLSKYPMPYYAVVRQRDGAMAYDCTGRLSQIKAPALVLHGKKDRLAPYRLAQEMHAGIPGSRMTTFDGGHLFFLSRMEQFTDLIEDFIDSMGRDRP